MKELRATSSVIGPPRDPVIAAWFGGNRSASGVNVTADTAMKVTAVLRAVSILAQTYASLPLDVYRVADDGTMMADRKHPLSQLLRDQPNKWQTSFEWREMMAGHFALRGACYSEIVSTGGRAIDQLVPLHPDRVRPFPAPNGQIAFEYMPKNGPSRIILQSEMHFQLLMAGDGFTPLSPIACAREAIGLALAAEEHGARLFSNGTRLSGILKMTGSIKDDERRKKLLKGFSEAYSGNQNAHKTALLEDGMEWQSLGMTSEDAQLLESRKFQIAEIARTFGVPLHKLAELDRSTNNNIEHQGIEFVQDTILPGSVRWAQAMQRDLFFGESRRTHCARFDLDGLMRGDSTQRAALYANGRQWGWLSADDVRRREGLNPIKGGDVYLTPSNMTGAGTALTINNGVANDKNT
ncbi:MAG: phage portal protein [Pseudomonadota bacterium]